MEMENNVQSSNRPLAATEWPRTRANSINDKTTLDP